MDKKECVERLRNIEEEVSWWESPPSLPSQLRRWVESGYYEDIDKKALNYEIDGLYDIELSSSTGAESEAAGTVRDYCLTLLEKESV